jgi:formylglycine-generating enzyme required for sulfatase activity
VANYGGSATPSTNPIGVGSYVNTTSSYGVFDMLGNVTELTDTSNPSAKVQLFSGSWGTLLSEATLWNVNSSAIFRSTANATPHIGFRVAAVPEPATIALASVGIASLAGLDWMKRRKKKARAANAQVIA